MPLRTEDIEFDPWALPTSAELAGWLGPDPKDNEWDNRPRLSADDLYRLRNVIDFDIPVAPPDAAISPAPEPSYEPPRPKLSPQDITRMLSGPLYGPSTNDLTISQGIERPLETDPHTALDLPIGPQELAGLAKGLAGLGAAGLVRLSRGGLTALKKGTPYKEVILALNEHPESYVIPHVPRTTYHPLVAFGETLNTPMPNYNYNSMGQYWPPALLEEMGLQRPSRAGDLIVTKPDVDTSLRHEYLHHLVEAMTQPFGPMRDRNREHLMNDLLREFNPAVRRHEARGQLRQALQDALYGIPEPAVREKAIGSLRRLYPEAEDAALAEEAVARNMAPPPFGQWAFDIALDTKYPRGAAMDIYKAIDRLNEVRKLREMVERRAPKPFSSVNAERYIPLW